MTSPDAPRYQRLPEAYVEEAKKLRLDSGHEGWIATSDLESLQLDLLAGGDP